MNKRKTRREFLKYTGLAGLSLLGCRSLVSETAAAKRPNVLFLYLDDLNDWLGCMGGHPDVKTPHLDKLASEGVLFMNAYCPAPLSAPSRTATLSGKAPYQTGVYKNRHRITKSPVLDNVVLLPKYFKNNGYFVSGSGKIFHEADHDPQCWHEYWPALDRPNPETYMPPEDKMPLHGMEVPKKTWGNDWGPIPVDNEQTGDWKTSGWIKDKLDSNEIPEPFFLAWGSKKPHVPLYAPQKYFDMYPREKIRMPAILENDLDDVPGAAKEIGSYSWWWKPHEVIRKYGQARDFVRAYLACISFVDDCVGRVMEGLNNSIYKSNTIVVLVSDHGIHKGEKQNWSKYTLWKESANTPLMFAGPGIKAGNLCREPANHMDIYPTLVYLCALGALKDTDGTSLAQLLKEPSGKTGRVSITSYGRGLNSVSGRDFRYIRYADGSEELYNIREDPHEWHNLASMPKYEKIKRDLARHIPGEQRKQIPR